MHKADSSYYDICAVGGQEYWAIGKHGIVTQINEEGALSKVAYPTTGNDLLNMDQFDDNNLIMCGDKGYIYQHDRGTGNWTVNQLKGHENDCLYSICIVDENTAFISGGKSKIASSKRVIPFGFVLKTTDRGHTWKVVYKSVMNMVWSIKHHKATGKLYALIYTPVKSKVVSSSDMGETWEIQSEKNGLYHDFIFDDGEIIFAGGKNGKYRKNGILVSNNRNNNFKTGLFWDVDQAGNFAIASGTGGNLAYRSDSGNWQLISTAVPNNLYEIAFINSRSAYIVGNSKTIIRVNFDD